MTQLTDQERTAQMKDMRSFDEQMPCVGIFWYDSVDRSFFGVRKKEITPQMVEAAAEKGSPYYQLSGDGRRVEFRWFTPGGRVVWSIDKFNVLVGKWAEHKHDSFLFDLE